MLRPLLQVIAVQYGHRCAMKGASGPRKPVTHDEGSDGLNRRGPVRQL